jgi:putative oxidoreductase
MEVRSVLRRSAARVLAVAAGAAFVVPLLTRLAVGHAFYLTGGGKLKNPESVAEFFGALGIPFPALNAAIVANLEYYGGLALIVGLGTRVVAAGLAATMAVALATADRESFVAAVRGVGEAGVTDVVPAVFLLFLLWLAFYGPGTASLDALVARVFAGRRGAAEPAPAVSRPAA